MQRSHYKGERSSSWVTNNEEAKFLKEAKAWSESHTRPSGSGLIQVARPIIVCKDAQLPSEDSLRHPEAQVVSAESHDVVF